MSTREDQHQQLIASECDEGSRLDVFLTRRVTSLSRSEAQRLIRTGHVLLDGKPGKASALVAPGHCVDLTIPPPIRGIPEPESLPLAVVYDDEDLVVIDKAAGMVVHPAAGHATGTLVNALLHHVAGLSGIGGIERPGIVHRLDRGTSGLMVVAKNDKAHRALAGQFQDRTIAKEYLALVWGRPVMGLTMSQPIGRDPHNRQKMSTRAGRARSALTRIESVEPFQGVSLVRLTIGTGRTHQIRVHLSEAGHPVVGDAVYGGVRQHLPAELMTLGRLTRPFLHAARLAFAHPTTGIPLSFEAPLPADLEDVLATLGRVKRARTPSSRA
ncbi:MAG: RluA family pseudouridine synthase [Vicinamibacterales bacterium]